MDTNTAKTNARQEAVQLTEKDLHCIARQLQSAWRAPEQEDIPTDRLFYGCWYCKYSHDCRKPTQMNYKKALGKLSELTGVNVHPAYQSIVRTFLPESVFIVYPEEIELLEKYHPEEFPAMKKYLEELIFHSRGCPDYKQGGVDIEEVFGPDREAD